MIHQALSRTDSHQILRRILHYAMHGKVTSASSPAKIRSPSNLRPDCRRCLLESQGSPPPLLLTSHALGLPLR